jgi:hypothetical protein
VILPRGFHPFPSRTRKLSPAGPIVLYAKVCGRVGRRRINLKRLHSEMNGAFCVLSRFEAIHDTQAIDNHGINAAPVPLPSPTLLGSWSLRFNVRSSPVRRKKLLALRATWRASFQEPAAARAILKVWLHLCGYFRLCTFHASGPFLTPTGQKGCLPA